MAALLKDGDEEATNSLVFAIAALHPDERGAALLGEALRKSPSARIRQGALGQLTAMGQKAKTRPAALGQLDALDRAGREDPDPAVRSWASYAAQCVRDGRGLYSRSGGYEREDSDER